MDIREHEELQRRIRELEAALAEKTDLLNRACDALRIALDDRNNSMKVAERATTLAEFTAKEFGEAVASLLGLKNQINALHSITKEV
jgi:hypothetical protein